MLCQISLNNATTLRSTSSKLYLFFPLQILLCNMFAPWRLFASVKVLQHLRSVTILMALAILLVIAIIAVVAKIAYEDRSWVAIFFLVVTIVQVLK